MPLVSLCSLDVHHWIRKKINADYACYPLIERSLCVNKAG